MRYSHGAKQSTPTRLLDILEPGVIVVSNPDSNKFLHPCKCAIQKHLFAISFVLGKGRGGALGAERWPVYQWTGLHWFGA